MLNFSPFACILVVFNVKLFLLSSIPQCFTKAIVATPAVIPIRVNIAPVAVNDDVDDNGVAVFFLFFSSILLYYNVYLT